MTSDRIKGLDGLRTFACLAVVGSHLNLPYLSGGWLGVDAFFVLSGYLITGILLRDHERDGISLRAFYTNRMARLYPALIVLVTLGVPIRGTLTPSPGGYPGTVIQTLTYTTDLAVGFGDMSSGFGHAWSLAIEEQFYLLWPVILILARTRRRIMLAAGILGGFSLAAMVLTPWWVQHLPASYYLPHTRVWEILVGCVLATCAPRVGRRAAAWAGWAGAALMVGAYFVADLLGRPDALMMTIECAVAAGAAILLIIACGSPGAVNRVLSRQPLVWLGQRSYGMYLFHVPVLMCATHYTPLRRTEVAVLVVVATIALAACSYALVERPVMAWAASRRRLRAPRPVPSLTSVPQELFTRVPVAEHSDLLDADALNVVALPDGARD